MPSQNVLTEPLGRNTAPCIGLAAKWISRYDPNAIMIILPADHIIQGNGKIFARAPAGSPRRTRK